MGKNPAETNNVLFRELSPHILHGRGRPIMSKSACGRKKLDQGLSNHPRANHIKSEMQILIVKRMPLEPLP
jgi:hypothetical protein